MFQCLERTSRPLHVRLRTEPYSAACTFVFIVCSSKWFQDSIGHAGINKMLDGFDDRSAYALCTFGYCEGPGHEPIIFEGRTNVSVYFI